MYCHKECPMKETIDQREFGQAERPICSVNGAQVISWVLNSQKVSFREYLIQQGSKELNRARHQGGVQLNITHTKEYLVRSDSTWFRDNTVVFGKIGE